MAVAAKRPCSSPGCSALTDTGRCPAHVRKPYLNAPRTHGKLYHTYRWRKARGIWLKQYPDCWTCGETANEVDHINTMGEFWDRDNWASICHRCHLRKTARERSRAH